jgi:septum site-determining protein MinD
MDPTSDAAQAYIDLVHRFLGEECPQRFLELPKQRGLLSRIFGSDPVTAYAG